MTMTTRLLETGFDTKFHALQIIFVRMLATAILGSLYMWIKKVPDFPLGNPQIRGLLVLRGFAGFIGLFCSYCKCAANLALASALMEGFLRLPLLSEHIRCHRHQLHRAHVDGVHVLCGAQG